MGAPRVVSVNVGQAFAAGWAGHLGRTAIDKHPLGWPVHVGSLGLDGDEQADTDNHGGTYQAVYAYAREDLGWWSGRLGRPLRDGLFGENLTTTGLEVSSAVIGERWRAGGVLLEVTQPRIPCGVFRNWMGERGWVKRFAEAGRAGAYLRVVEPGWLEAGDPIDVVHRPAHSATVRDVFRLHYGDPEPLARLEAATDLPPEVLMRVRRAARAASETGAATQ
ncbi:MAG: MOSC domain-containing protein [Carbonactinosporaceae bacterium]